MEYKEYVITEFVNEKGQWQAHIRRQCGASEVRVVLAGTSSRGLLNKATLDQQVCQCPFDSEVRTWDCRLVMRTSESGHQDGKHISVAGVSVPVFTTAHADSENEVVRVAQRRDR